MRFNQFLFIVLLLLGFSACDPNLVYEENLKIGSASWEQEEKAFFEFDIEDTTIAYSIYLNFRHGGDYAYQNIYLFTKTISPNGLLAKDTAQMLLADNKGRWLGKGIGDIFDYQFKYKEGYLFPAKGTYTFEIEQAMRNKTLDNVTDIGISIKKVKQ